MFASAGDRIVIVSNQLDRPVRDGEILEVRGPDGSPPYLVRWSDSGRTGLVYPGPDAKVEHRADEPAARQAKEQTGEQARGQHAAETRAAAVPAPRADVEAGHVRIWQVEVQIFESGDDTTARAVLMSDSPTRLEARGRAHRNPRDEAVPEIGDQVATARALRRLADQLLSAAAADIADVEGHPVQLPR